MTNIRCPICSRPMREGNGSVLYKEGQTVRVESSHIIVHVYYVVLGSFYCRDCGVIYLLERVADGQYRAVSLPNRILLPETRLHHIPVVMETVEVKIPVKKVNLDRCRYNSHRECKCAKGVCRREAAVG